MKNNVIQMPDLPTEQHPEQRQMLRRQKSTAESIVQAQQDERARIGNELHDNVNQILTCAHLYLANLDRENPDFEMLKKKAMDTLLMGIDEIRNLSREMVMHDFQTDGLIGSVSNLVDDIRFSKAFTVQFVHSDINMIEALNPNIKITIFRIIQEQLKNIIRYSHGTNIQISLHCCDLQFRLQIKDDGLGFDPETTKRGLGLSNIYERTRLYNGKVILDSAPGRGCSLIVNIPLSPFIALLKNVISYVKPA
ncbi:MAG TPA: ATP-binding protein [Puia sp.]|nr:ATP-binding protein [Puia sp.]